MSKFNESGYPLGRDFDDNDAPREPPVAASTAPNMQQDARTLPRATGHLTAMANAAHQHPDV